MLSSTETTWRRPLGMRSRSATPTLVSRPLSKPIRRDFGIEIAGSLRLREGLRLSRNPRDQVFGEPHPGRRGLPARQEARRGDDRDGGGDRVPACPAPRQTPTSSTPGVSACRASRSRERCASWTGSPPETSRPSRPEPNRGKLASVPPMPLPPGSRLGPYEVVSPLGAGGMGEVYRARDPRLARDVAVKVLPEDSTAAHERLQRFEREAKAVGALNHPNLLAVFDVGQHEGAPFVVFELLEGQTLRGCLARKALPPRKALDYAIQIARGLAAAHEKGVVHRDLKPENLFLTRDGRVKILDFGLAKLLPPLDPGHIDAGTPTVSVLSGAGKVLGTVGYMSPEQVRRTPVDHRSDIFSFGSVLYEMLAGERAFKGESEAETMAAIVSADPPRLAEADGRLFAPCERIVRHCLEKLPVDRFQSARGLVFDLESAAAAAGASPVQGTGVPRPHPAAWWRAAPPAGRAALGVLALVVVLVGADVGGWRTRLTRHAAAPPAAPRIESLAVLPLANLSR